MALPTPSAPVAHARPSGVRLVAARSLPWLFAALVPMVLVQAFLGGAALLTDDSYRAMHASFVHVLELLPVLAIVAGVLAKDRSAWIVGLVLFVLISAQYGLIRGPGIVPAFHVLNGLVIFGVALLAFHRRMPMGRPSPA